MLKGGSGPWASWRYLSVRAGLLGWLLGLVTAGLMGVLAWYAAARMERLGILLLGGVLLCGLAYTVWRYLWVPYRETEKVLRLFAGGYTVQGIFELRQQLTPGMEAAIGRVQALLNREELVSASKRQAQYLALQNQINPHFLYNTLEGIRGEALMAGLNNVAEMTEALATFFRYTISNMEHLVTLEDELTNIESYYIIQQYRFGKRLGLEILFGDEGAEELLRCRLPKLTLQPIVENAIFHGIERKVGKGMVRVKLEATERRLLITVSDDGMGMPPERLRELRDKLSTQSLDYERTDREQKGGIAVVNVNNRIRLLFGEEYGIHVYSAVDVGTDVEITLPLDAG